MALANPEWAKLDMTGYAVPGKGRGLLDVFGWRFLLKLLIRKETATRYRNSVLGWVWSYVRPAAQFVIFYVVLGVFLQMNKGIENFALYLFSGIIVVNFFNEGFNNSTKSLIDNAHLVRKIYMPRELFPVAAVFVSFVHFLPQLVVLMIAAAFMGWIPSPLVLAALLVAMLTMTIFTLGLGMFFGSLNVPFRDAQNFVELILLVATWASPVLYSWIMVADVLPNWLLQVYLANPLTNVVELFHFAIWTPVTPDGHAFPANFVTLSAVAFLLAVLTLVIGQLVFRKIEPRFAQDL